MTVLHHYTSINSLACILESKRLRFSRADTFDDPHEARVVGNKNVGRVNFATCWTSEDESLPQWHLYGDRYRGVMITIEPTFTNAGEPIYFEPFTIHNSSGHDYRFTPKSCSDDHIKPLRVDYISQNDFDCCSPANEAQTTKVLKLDCWGFQQEVRFNISLVGNADKICASNDFSRDDHFLGYPFCERLHYDHPLLDSVYRRIKITVGPCCDYGDKVLVQALMDKYLDGKEIQTSTLEGLVRLKALLGR